MIFFFIGMVLSLLSTVICIVAVTEQRSGRYLVAQCGDMSTLEWPLAIQRNSTKRGRLLDAVAEKGGSAVVNAIPTSPDKLWLIAFCDSVRTRARTRTRTQTDKVKDNPEENKNLRKKTKNSHSKQEKLKSKSTSAKKKITVKIHKIHVNPKTKSTNNSTKSSHLQS